ncbi:MAG: hypothetical protein LBM93_06870, partial [Oscillospiraceae bacterium]|nr:hypothetical protein [Oscillospiraceae bacterium]
MSTFYLPGLTTKFMLNFLIISMIKRFPERFRDGLKIGAVYGDFPTSLWNGGRTIGGNCEERFMRNAVKTFNDLGVPVRYTFTNPLIEKKHLSDYHCNLCMEIADNGMNEVTVFSPVLEEYIRNKYPSFKIVSSTCKEIREIPDLIEELEKDYKMVVLDYNLNNHFDLLEQIPKHLREKCEILINACCVPNCPKRGWHYRFIGQNSIDFFEAKAKGVPYEEPPFECEYGKNNHYYNIQGYPTFVSPKSIEEEYIPRGFKHFKIEGRTGSLFGGIESYVNYLSKDETKDENRFTILF